MPIQNFCDSLGWRLLFIFLILEGCQAQTEVLIREPGNYFYSQPPENVFQRASKHWEYAMLSRNAYLPEEEEHLPAPVSIPEGLLKAPSDFSENSCFSSNPTRLTIAGWKRAKWFPTQKSCSKNGLNEKICEIYKKAKDLDMHIEVWEKETSAGLEITVVFRGTDSWIDWLTNLNWIGRYIPLWPDQYSLLAEHFSHEFVESLAKKIQEDKSSVSLSAAGHSLGGGLAQYFAYSLPSETTAHYAIPRVSHVYAFDPSPVTGWYIVNKVQRETNAENLIIDRIFEHGEILAYLRLLLSYVNPPSKVPAITEIRYNFDQSFNPFSSHSMDFLACNLCENAKNSVPPKCSRAED